MALSMAGGGGRIVQRRGTVLGNYEFGEQIGAGSFSVVWLARHRVRGTKVAVKEIIMEKLNQKLHDSLLSEIVILKKINHPNIIGLHDILVESKRIFIVLEYCKGGDLSLYIRNGRLPEATAKHFMQQLACGLKVLRDNNLVHRDLKPQNLLLSTNDESAILKIADFGFARSLDDELAETVCGSPLYMAPEIMKMKKYDAKADLWSIGTILFQLVTGKTPFTGCSQMELMRNISNSTGLQFPLDVDLSNECIDLCQKLLRRNPVERLTFEEFFEHPFLQSYQEMSSRSQPSSEAPGEPSSTTYSHVNPSNMNIQENSFPLDDLYNGSNTRVSTINTIRSTHGFSVNNRIDKRPVSVSPVKISSSSKSSSKHDPGSPSEKTTWNKSSNLKESKRPIDQRPSRASIEEPATEESMELIREYVVVSGPPYESSSLCMSKTHNSSCESESLSPPSLKNSASIPIATERASKIGGTVSLENCHYSPTSGTSQGSVDMGEIMEQPSSHCMTRIRSLQQCASAITELVQEEIKTGRHLEAFSVQLVILAIWKQALHICHAQAAIEEIPSRETKAAIESMNKKVRDSRDFTSSIGFLNPDSGQIEKAFLLEVENAEAISREFRQDDTTEMPDAMEIIFQHALLLGRKGAVDELMDNFEQAAVQYTKAVKLLYFLLVEAPSLNLNPPFLLTNSDRLRLRSYLEILNNRQSQYRSERMTLFKNDPQESL